MRGDTNPSFYCHPSLLAPFCWPLKRDTLAIFEVYDLGKDSKNAKFKLLILGMGHDGDWTFVTNRPLQRTKRWTHPSKRSALLTNPHLYWCQLTRVTKCVRPIFPWSVEGAVKQILVVHLGPFPPSAALPSAENAPPTDSNTHLL